MKKLVLGAAAAAMTLTTFAATAASARDYDGWNRGSYNARNYDHDRYRHEDRRWDNGYAYGYRYDRDDYRRDRGDTAGAALLGGVVGLMLGAAISDHNNQPAYNYGYSGYGYSPYGYNSYGYNGYGYNGYGY